jgi:hypothetical protein
MHEICATTLKEFLVRNELTYRQPNSNPHGQLCVEQKLKLVVEDYID